LFIRFRELTPMSNARHPGGAPVLLRCGVPERQCRRDAASRERLQSRAQPIIRVLELRNCVELVRRGRERGLRMTLDGAQRLPVEVEIAHVVHQRGVERGGIHRTRDAASDHHGCRRRIVGHDHARRELTLDQDRCVRGDPAGAADEVVEAIVQEQRVGRVRREAFSDLCRIDRAVTTGMTRTARAAIAAEGFVIEQPLAIADSTR
jgi:hypothetical protein